MNLPAEPGTGRTYQEPLFTAAFVALWFVGFFQEMAHGLMVHLPGFLGTLGAGESKIGLLYAAGALVALALRPMMGRVIDQWGRKRVMLTGGLVLTLSTLAYIPITSFAVPVFVVRIVYTSAEILLFTTVLAIGADIIPESRRVQGLGILGISGLIPIGFGSILGDTVVDDGNFVPLFVMVATVAFLSWCLVWTLPDLPSVDPQRERYRGFRYVVGQRDLMPVWLITGSFALGMITLFTFLRTFVDSNGVGSVGLYLGTYSAVAVVARIVGGSWADRLGTTRMLVPAMTAIAAQFLVLATASSPTQMVVAAALGGFGHGLVFPILTTLVVDRATRAERGTGLAVFSGLFDVVVLAGAPAAGLIIESAGYGPAFTTVGVAVALGLAGFLVWDRRVRPAALHR